jgi:hypothetical protein
MSEVPKLWQPQIQGEKNTGPQQEEYKPLVTAQVIIQEKEKFVDFLHAIWICICSILEVVKVTNI